MPSRMTKFAPAEQQREVSRFGLAATYILWSRSNVGHLVWNVVPCRARHMRSASIISHLAMQF
jgi:hypothetical protein